METAAVASATPVIPSINSSDKSTRLAEITELSERLKRSMFAMRTDQVLLDFYESQLAACQVTLRSWKEGNNVLSEDQVQKVRLRYLYKIKRRMLMI